jgi:hypothetical protein
MRIQLTTAQRLLCQSLSDSDQKNQAEAAHQLCAIMGDEQAFMLAQQNEVGCIVAHHLSLAPEVKDESAAVSRWRRMHHEIAERLASYMDELDRIAERLAEANVPLAALKNAGIARGIYPCLGCCPMGDLDMLIERPHFIQAHQVLMEEGYHFEFRSPLEEASLEGAERSGGTEYWKILPNGQKLWLELQWRPVAGRWIRPDQEPQAEQLLARSLPIPGTAVRLLSAEDNLLQVALHTAKHSYVRAPGFRLHTDVDRIVRRQAIDWNLFLTRVLALQVQTAVYFSLAIPKEIFGSPIPDWVVERLRPAAWKERVMGTWLQRVGLFNPHERKFSRLEFVVFTALLYDDMRGLWRGMFPDAAWMRAQYRFHSAYCLPYYHCQRLFHLAFRRVAT